MRTAIHFLFVAISFFVVAGCNKRSASPGEDVNVQTLNKWVPLKDLRAAADKHLHSRYADFDSSGSLVTASVHRDGTNLVTFQYFRGFGLPVYWVIFDASGQITFSTNHIATEEPKR